MNWWNHIPEHINPNIIEIGSFQIRYYGLMYLVAFATIYLLVLHRLKNEKYEYPKAVIQNYFVWAILGVMIGGKLGFVLFYDFMYFITHPLKIFNPFAWGDEVFRRGSIVRLLGGLEKEGRMAQLLVSIEDPLCLRSEGSDTPIMLTDSYVRVEIQGRRIPAVIPVKRDYVHEGENVWVMNAKDELEIRRVKIIFRGKDTVWITNGLEEGERIVTTDIATPVQGMPLRLESSATDTAQKPGGRDKQKMEGHR